jgi:HAMP domain-containing protein
MIAVTDQGGYGKLFFWLLVLIALVVIGFFVAVWVKRRLQAPD